MVSGDVEYGVIDISSMWFLRTMFSEIGRVCVCVAVENLPRRCENHHLKHRDASGTEQTSATSF